MEKFKKLIKKQGFTLVELIIVIAIIAVLAVAAFMMLTKWLGKSRDSRRLGDLGTIKKALEITYSDTDRGLNMYPAPTDAADVLDGSGVVMWNQGVFGLDTIAEMDNMQKAPKDPGDQSYYKYAVTLDKKEFQLGTILEDGSGVSVMGRVLASNGEVRLDGNYDGYVSYPTTGGTMIFKTPSLLVKGETKIEVFSGKVTNLMLDGEEDGTEIDLRSIKTDSDTTAEEISVALGIDEKSALIVLKNEVGLILEKASTTAATCDIRPSINNALFEDGNPSVEGTLWQNEDSTSPCYFYCDDGYSWDGSDCVESGPEDLSCYTLYKAGHTTSGTYTIDPDGIGGRSSIVVYCDMDNNGGGWTRVFRSQSSGSKCSFAVSTDCNTLYYDTSGNDFKYSDDTINAILNVGEGVYMSVSNYTTRYWKDCIFSLTDDTIDFRTSGCGRSYSDLLWNNVEICSHSNCYGGKSRGLTDQCYGDCSQAGNMFFIVDHGAGPYVGNASTRTARGLQTWYVR